MGHEIGKRCIIIFGVFLINAGPSAVMILSPVINVWVPALRKKSEGPLSPKNAMI